jgi:hypothetical protein
LSLNGGAGSGNAGVLVFGPTAIASDTASRSKSGLQNTEVPFPSTPAQSFGCSGWFV